MSNLKGSFIHSRGLHFNPQTDGLLERWHEADAGSFDPPLIRRHTTRSASLWWTIRGSLAGGSRWGFVSTIRRRHDADAKWLKNCRLMDGKLKTYGTQIPTWQELLKIRKSTRVGFNLIFRGNPSTDCTPTWDTDWSQLWAYVLKEGTSWYSICCSFWG